MTESHAQKPPNQLYAIHPVNEQQILDTLQSKGIALETLTQNILQAYDMDHFGGTEAIDILADKSSITQSTRVLDVCCGMGGPARYLAQNYGCHVTGIDITASRIEAATRFAQLVKLNHLVDFQVGNALDMPFPDQQFDVVIGQDAWWHVPDKAVLLAECARVLKPEGILAFSDMLKRNALTPTEVTFLTEEMAAAPMISLDDYNAFLADAGFTLLEREDLSDQYAQALMDGQAPSQKAQKEMDQRGQTRQQDESYGGTFYVSFVGFYSEKKMGSGRFVARLDAK